MNSGEKLNNQETKEADARKQEIWAIEELPSISLLLEMGISFNDIDEMDLDTLKDLRSKLENELAKQSKKDSPAETITPTQEGTSEKEGTPAAEEGPEIAPPVAPVNPAETKDDEPAANSNPADTAANLADTINTNNKSEKKKGFFTLNRKIGAAVLAISMAAITIGSQFGLFQSPQNAGATDGEKPAITMGQNEQEASSEFEIFDGTDYRNYFLNAEGNGYNEAKQSYRINPATGEQEPEETSWKYDISPRVLDDYKAMWEAGDHDQAELDARTEIFNQLTREPEFLAIVANRLDAEGKTELGLGGIDTVKGMEQALTNADTLAKAEAGMKALQEHEATSGEFTTFTGYATNYYMRSNNEANIQNDSKNIEAARTATRYYDNVDVFIMTMPDGSKIIFDIDCLNVVIPVEEGTPEEEVEPGTPIIEQDTPDDDGTGEETGTETGTETGDETGNETGDETGSETGNETGNETGSETGTETGNETGTETGAETGVETGTETGTETGVETGTEDGGLTPKDPAQIEENMQTGDESTNTVTPLPAGEETSRPDQTSTYNPDTNKFEDPNDPASSETPADSIISQDGSGSTVGEIIESADQTHATDVNLAPEDQADADAQQAANESEITDSPTLTTEESGNRFDSEFGDADSSEPAPPDTFSATAATVEAAPTAAATTTAAAESTDTATTAAESTGTAAESTATTDSTITAEPAAAGDVTGRPGS